MNFLDNYLLKIKKVRPSPHEGGEVMAPPNG